MRVSLEYHGLEMTSLKGLIRQLLKELHRLQTHVDAAFGRVKGSLSHSAENWYGLGSPNDGQDVSYRSDRFQKGPP
jgi:hypothetical protein